MSMREVVAAILGGGVATGLYPLTRERAKAAIPFAGKYRLIDIALSNCLNSHVHRAHVLTQFNSVSLHRHIYQTYKFDSFSGGWVRILATEQTPSYSGWDRGSADAVRRQIHEILASDPPEVIVLAGDQLYQMDLRKPTEFHRQRGADVTIVCHGVEKAKALRLGLVKRDDQGLVSAFTEKPGDEAALSGWDIVDDPMSPFLASMGIYIFNPLVLATLLEQTEGANFGSDIMPIAIQRSRVYAYQFHGYWEDIGNIRSFYEANLALARPNTPFDLYNPAAPLYTRPRFLPSSRTDECRLRHTLVAGGCCLCQVDAENAIVGVRSHVRRGTRLLRTVLMGADYYETEEEHRANRRIGRPDIGIGDDCVIEGAIVDKNARIGDRVTIRSHQGEPDADTEMYVVQDGIVIIPKRTVIPDDTVI
jgi:glucose-1-phosphate adenylyltransferase